MACGNNVLTNGDFSTNDLTGWSAPMDGAGTASADTGQAVLDITSTPTFTTQLFQSGLSLTAGQSYTFDFILSGDTTSINVAVIKHDSPYTNLSGNLVVNPTPTPTLYSLTFTAPSSEPNARLRFYPLGGGTGTVTIDDVCFGETSSTGDTFDASSGQGCMDLTGNATEAGIYQSGFNINVNTTYGVTFDVIGPSGQTLNVKLVDHATPTTNLGYLQAISMTGVQQSIDTAFVATANSSNARLVFDGTGIVGQVCIDNICLGEVAATINADFTYVPPTIYENDLITFTDTTTATNGVTSWAWDFGDTNSSTDQNPTHSYTTAGSYDVELTATGPDGSDVITKTLVVNTSSTLVGATDISREYVMDGGGNITLVSTQWNVAQRLLNINANNLMGETHVMFNVFTGLLQASTPGSDEILLANIDNGNYEVIDITNSSSLRTGNDAAIAVIGTRFPIDAGSGLSSRGSNYWDWWASVTGTGEVWPTLYNAQYNKAQSL